MRRLAQRRTRRASYGASHRHSDKPHEGGPRAYSVVPRSPDWWPRRRARYIEWCPARRAVNRSLFGDALAHHRPHARRSSARTLRCAEPAERLLHRLRQRGRLALHRLRLHLAAAVRQGAHRLHWRDCRGAVGPERHLRGHGRRDHPPRSGGRQRRLQVHRRREDVDAPRSPRDADDRDDRRRSQGREPAVRRRARPPVRTERGAWDLPLHRWWKVVREGALQGRVHERERRANRSERSAHRLRDALAAAAELHRGAGIRRRGQRDLQEQRRRHDMEAAHERASRGDPGQHRARAEQSEDALRHGGGGDAGDAGRARDHGDGRLLQVDGRRRALGRDAQAGPAAPRPHRRRRPADARDRPDQRERRLQLVHRLLADGGRGQHVERRARCAGWRRLPEDVDQPEQSEHPPPRRRSGRRGLGQPRRVVEQLVQPADGSDVPRLHRQRVSVSRVRWTAGLGLGVRREPLG